MVATVGYTGNYVAQMHGLVAAQTQAGRVYNDPNDVYPLPPTLSEALALGNVVSAHTIVLPAGTVFARFATNIATTIPSADIDMYVYDPNGNVIDAPVAFGEVGEQVDVQNPVQGGTYTVVLYGYDVFGGDFTDFTLSSWSVGANVGNATIAAPTTATLGTVGNITVNWTGLAPSSEYLGFINHVKDGVTISTTIIDINKP